MIVDCNSAGWAGLVASAFGACTLCFSFMVWFWPDSKFVQRIIFARYRANAEASRIERRLFYAREVMGPANLWNSRIVAPLVGVAFVGVGTALIASEVSQCVHPFAVDIGPGAAVLQFRYWPPIVLAVPAAAALATFASRHFPRRRYRLLVIVLFALWSVAGCEAAAHHLGRGALAWGAVCAALFIAAVFVSIQAAGPLENP